MHLRRNKGPGWLQQREQGPESRRWGREVVGPDHRRLTGPCKDVSSASASSNAYLISMLASTHSLQPTPSSQLCSHTRVAFTLPSSTQSCSPTHRVAYGHTYTPGNAYTCTHTGQYTHIHTHTHTVLTLTHWAVGTYSAPLLGFTLHLPAYGRGTGAVLISLAPCEAQHGLSPARPGAGAPQAVPEASDPCPQTNRAGDTPQKGQMGESDVLACDLLPH